MVELPFQTYTEYVKPEAIFLKFGQSLRDIVKTSL